MWPFGKRAPVEKRQDGTSYTDVVIRALVAAATGEQQDTAHGTAAAEAAASAYARAFATAKVTPMNGMTGGLTPSVLSNIVREMVTRGEAMYLIRVEGGEVGLYPVGSWDIRGGDRKQDWMVRVDTYGPTSSSTTELVSYAQVLHFMWSYDVALPWVGVGPLSRASVTGSLHGGLDRSLGYEVRGPVGHLLPTPQGPDSDDEDEDPLADLRRDISNLKGAAALVETTSAGFGEGMAAAPRKDWVPSRIGPNPPAPLVDLQEQTFDAMLAACGVPAALYGRGGDAAGRREAWRQFLHGSVTPIGEIIAQELRSKLEVPSLTLTFEELYASDLQGRARALQSMVKAGVPVDEARRLAGLE